MPKFIIETTARASIREFWSVDADDETDARNMLHDGDGELLFEEVLGDEEDRAVAWVHNPEALTSHMRGERTRKEAPAILDTMRYLLEQTIEQDERYGIELTEGEKDAAQRARAILARIDGLAEAGENCTCGACGRPEIECSGAPCPAVIADREG